MNTTTTLRRFIDLFEAVQIPVSVTVDAYVGLDQVPGTSDAFPTYFTFEFSNTMRRSDVTQAIKAEIQAATGYEPQRFRWKPVSASSTPETG